MAAVKIILPIGSTRSWHKLLAQRITQHGHEVSVSLVDDGEKANKVLDAILFLECEIMRVGKPCLASRVPMAEVQAGVGGPDVIVDLTTKAPVASQSPVISVSVDGNRDPTFAAMALCRGRVPCIHLYVDAQPVRRASPMADSRVFLSKGLNDVLARVITLICNQVEVQISGHRPGLSSLGSPEEQLSAKSSGGLLMNYSSKMLPRLARRYARRLRYRGGHWHVGYRFVDGPGVIENGSTQGGDWTLLSDAKSVFYADPFPYEHEGQYFIFVEELTHTLGKGVISVSEYTANGCFSRPRKILEQPFHLSYPQVFSRDGDIWMIPESGAGRRVSLYRAVEFPDRWVEHCVLLPDREIFDATLVEHGGFLWLLGTERDGAGSASDTMVIYFAESFFGPWQAHRMNPILIDKSAARPGGAFVRMNSDLMLPIQDGTRFYGGGLGVSRITRLDQDCIELTSPQPVETFTGSRFQSIHTLNRHGRLEVIDAFSDCVKRV